MFWIVAPSKLIRRKLYKQANYKINMTTEIKNITLELKAIKEELHFIRQHIVDMDLVLTDSDLESLEEAEKDLKQGKTKRLI